MPSPSLLPQSSLRHTIPNVEDQVLRAACLHTFETLADVVAECPWRLVVVRHDDFLPSIVAAEAVVDHPVFFGLATDRAAEILATRSRGKVARGSLQAAGSAPSASRKLTVVYREVG